MTDKIEHFFYSCCHEWHMYRNQDLTLEELYHQFEEAFFEAECLEMERGDVLASQVDADDVESPFLCEELLECDDSPLSDIVANFCDACTWTGEMIDEYGGDVKCDVFCYGQSIITDERRAELVKAS
ncbi:MAG: hypothetical protein R3C11_24925 [Planctomycetaceae bacterium]